MPSKVEWDELHLAEEPAAEMLGFLGYGFVEAKALDAERGALSDPVLRPRLAAALRRLNPWIDDGNVEQAMRAVSAPPAGGLLEASAALHTALVYGVALPQDRGRGLVNQQVRFIDFDDPGANEWLFTRQYRVQGVSATAVPDLVVFVNGLPLAVIECKSPTLKAPLAEGIRQLRRYQELDGHRHQGAPRLFHTAQVLVAAAGERAVYGTVGTPAGFYGPWKVPYPETIDALSRAWGQVPRAQEVLLYGLFHKPNLLALVRDFVVFEAQGGQAVRKLARYPQFVAVQSALARIRDADRADRRGGVVWHTQGSGKSLTMLFLAVSLRRLLGNPTLVVVTDRRDLDRQISETFRRCGFPNPIRAKTSADLRAQLGKRGGRTLLTTVQKFHGAGDDGALDGSRDVYVMVDEAHRTQYRALAAHMRAALPEACFLGFTGTPLDRRDRSTREVFGEYIHTYGIREAVADGATVEILYEMRAMEEHVEGRSLDALFERYFRGLSDDDRGRLKRRYGTATAIAEAPARVKALALDMLEHFETRIDPNGFKAQVVASSRRAAVTWADTLAGLIGPGGPEVAVVMSSGPDDDADMVRHRRSKTEQKALIERFKAPGDPLKILVVCDMLLTGFDAPIEQVLYLDASLREHTLLQAVARVNRTAPGKDHGLIVDYWGVAAQLEEALAIFDPAQVRGAMTPRADRLPQLQSRHRRVLAFFEGVARDDLEACLAVIEPEDVRAEFEAAFKAFSQALDLFLPDPEGLAYADDLRWLGKLRAVARSRFHDEQLSLEGCRAKVRALIAEHIRGGAVETLVERVSILAPGFQKKLDTLDSDAARASEIEHAARHEIGVRMASNPAFYEKLSARLAQIIEQRQAQRISMAEQLELLQGVAIDLRGVPSSAEALGLSEAGFAVYGELGALEGLALDEDDRRSLARETVQALQGLAVVDWRRKSDVKRRMRLAIKQRLRGAGLPRGEVESATLRLMQVIEEQWA